MKQPKKVQELFDRLGYDTSELKYRYDFFYTDYLTDENCPECGQDVKIKSDATSDCPECGRKEVFPCSQCPLLEISRCDWSNQECSAFPKTNK